MSVENNEREIHCNGHEILIGTKLCIKKKLTCMLRFDKE